MDGRLAACSDVLFTPAEANASEMSILGERHVEFINDISYTQYAVYNLSGYAYA